MTELAEILADYDDADAPDGLDVATELAAIERAMDNPEADTPEREPFRLTEPEHYDWAGRKLARAQAEVERLEAWKADELYKLTRAFDVKIAVHQRDAAFFDAMIRASVLGMEPDAKGKRKVSAPHLSASVTHREHWEWPEDDALVAWAREQDPITLVRVKTTPDKTAIKSYVKNTGATPDGLTITTVESVRIEASL